MDHDLLWVCKNWVDRIVAKSVPKARSARAHIQLGKKIMALANTSMGSEGLKLNITQNTSLNWI